MAWPGASTLSQVALAKGRGQSQNELTRQPNADLEGLIWILCAGYKEDNALNSDWKESLILVPLSVIDVTL